MKKGSTNFVCTLLTLYLVYVFLRSRTYTGGGIDGGGNAVLTRGHEIFVWVFTLQIHMVLHGIMLALPPILARLFDGGCLLNRDVVILHQWSKLIDVGVLEK